MKKVCVLLALSVGLLGEDFAADKKAHFAGSAAIAGVSSQLAKHYGATYWEAFGVGVASALLVGIAKERIDGAGHGAEDIYDVYADTAGAIIGATIFSWEF